MRTWLRSILLLLRDILISVIVYSGIILVIAHFLLYKKSWNEILQLMNSPVFYTGLAFVIILIILRRTLSKRIKQKISLYTLLAVSVIILLLGITFMMLAYIKPIWDEQNLAYNLNAFGVGVTMVSLGFAFLFALYPIMTSQSSNELKNTEKWIDGKIKKLSEEASKIEYTLKECKSLIKELRELKEEQDTKSKDSD